MSFFKPKFWDKNKISFFSILLYPIVFIIKLVNLLKLLVVRARQFSVPVICVGNIYLGGTGKTPFCIKLFSIFKNLNRKPAIIKKKYKSFRDEILLLEQVGSVYEEKKRIHAIEKAIENKADLVILDDGFQDLSIKKDLSIICFNEKQWIGNGFMLPAGPLREELSSLKKADLVIMNGKKNINIEKKLLQENNKLKIYYTLHKPINMHEFKNKKILAFAGIGNPDNFINLLKSNKMNIQEEIHFPDHYDYSDKDLENLINKAEKKDSILLTTEKDYLRINENYKKNINFLKIETEIENENRFIEEIKKFI